MIVYAQISVQRQSGHSAYNSNLINLNFTTIVFVKIENRNRVKTSKTCQKAIKKSEGI